jgi:SAM-dependent methyltransferase
MHAAEDAASSPAAQRGLYRDVQRYYTRKLARFGPTALGVDWACELTQQLRFVQLLKVRGSARGSFSINDLGCGYGALVSFLQERHAKNVTAYHGVDLSPEMIGAARHLHGGFEPGDFATGSDLNEAADYSVASGIFNVKLGHTVQAWEGFVARTLHHLHQMSVKGFAVNFLMPLSGGAAAELYCTEAGPWAAHCERELQCEVEIVSNYGLREFTLIARRRSRAPAVPAGANARAAKSARR